MKKLLLILLCLPMIGFGQSWEKAYGGTNRDVGISVQQTTDGGYVIAGVTGVSADSIPAENTDFDVYLIKTDANGVEQWSQTYGDTSNQDFGYCVQQTTDGGYIITGWTDPFVNGDRDIYLIKTDDSGNSQWTKTFGGNDYEDAYTVQQTTDGGYIIVGTTSSFGSGNRDVYLIKTDSQGNSLWTQTFGGPDEEFGLSVQQTTDGGYIITGSIELSYVLLIKTDVNGVQLWSTTFGVGAPESRGCEVQQTTDGGYIITGFAFVPSSILYLIKTDGSGNSQWINTFSGVIGNSVQQTNDGGYIICGGILDVNGYPDVYLMKTDANGVEQWNQIYGDAAMNDEGFSVQQTTDGGYIICGYTESFGNGDDDVYLIKTDSQGNVTSTFNISISSSNRKLEQVVDLLGRETKGKKNEPLFYIYDDGTVEKRIVIE